MKIPENIITKLYELRDTHNQKRENRHRRVTMVTLQEVFERGVKAYQELNEPVSRNLSPEKKYNAGLARVKAFLYKAEKGSSYNGLYSHDNDLLDFNGISHEQFAEGGEILLAPNGKRSNLTPEQWHLVRTPEFKAWFGDWENTPETASKVIDKNGEPLVCYHGTLQKFTVFRTYFDNGTWHGKGAYFTSSLKDLKTNYVTAKDDIYLECFLDIKNALVVGKKNEGTWFEKEQRAIIKEQLRYYRFPAINYAYENSYDSDTLEKIVRKEFNESKSGELLNSIYRELGFDGIIFLSPHKLKGHTAPLKTKHFVCFNPTQIKLADGSNTTFDGSNPDIRFAEGGEILLAPNGKPSNLTPEQYRLVRTPEFKAWFGDWQNSPETASKVVDKNGEPMVVYHGTNNRFTQFEPTQPNFYSITEGTYFFTDIKEVAENFGDIVLPVFLLIDNPTYLDGMSSGRFNTWTLYDDEGNYGFIVSNSDTGGGIATEYAVENPEQIKLADGTNTTFDGSNPDIRFAEGGSMEVGGIVVNPTEIKCHKCDWKWKIKDGGNDLFICHKCHFDNSKFYKFIGLEGQKILDNVYDKGGSIKKPKFSIDYDEDRVKISIKGIGEVLLTETYPEYEFTEDISEDELSDLGIEEGDFIGKIEHLKVNDEYKGKGYAKLLMQKAIDVAKERGLMPLYLNASPMGYGGLNLSDLTSFYEGLGFRVFLHQGGNNLMIYNPDIRFKSGGEMSLSKTPAPKKERIYGSETNPKGSSSSGKAAKEITFSESTLKSIRNKIDEHNAKHPKKKVTIEVAKAVVRRGMGAYSSTHRPTIKGGRPNSRTAWGLARLNAFLYKAVNGKSKSGRYSEDNDLLDELEIKHQKFAEGGEVLLAPNGKPSNLTPEQWHLVRTPEFKAWFGDWENTPETASKVIDKNGEPLVAYHGSSNPQIQFFDSSKAGTVQYSDWGKGIYFTPSKSAADYYSNESLKKNDTEYNRLYEKYLETNLSEDLKAFQQRGRELTLNENTIVYGCFLNVRKPRVEPTSGMNDPFLAESAISYGQDGIFIMNNVNFWSYDEIVVFNSSQIKLADGSNTTFDSQNPDIRMEVGGIFHGSPHRFDKFSTQYMGTGEGAQAFGWGLYFTDLESIARSYAKPSIDNEFVVNGVNLKGKIPYNLLIDLDTMFDFRNRPEFYNKEFEKETINKLREYAIRSGDKVLHQNFGWIDDLNDLKFNRNLYKVTLHKGKTPDQYTWLEWDKELSKEQVSDILNKIGIVNEESKPNIDYEIENFLRFNERTGKGLYRYLENLYNSDKEASLILLRAGIDGIKYPAESLARGATSDTARGFNYVVFDENAVTIEDVEQFAKGGAFTPPYPINKAGGYDYSGKPAKKAEEFDLLTLPRDVNGTHCGNCFFFEKGMCLHKKIMLPVTDRMCCAVWDNADSERSYEKKLEKGDAPENTEKFPVNDRGGYDYKGKALETAEKFDLITLPKKIEGTNCANCGWFSPYKDGGYCFRPNILLPVTGRMSCKLWNSLSVKRDWSIFDEGGEIGNYIPGFKTGDEVSFIGTGLKVITAKVDFYMPPGDHSYADMYSTSRGYVKNGNLVPAVTGAKKEGSGQGYKSFRGMGGGKSYKVSFKDGYEFTASSYIDDRNDAILEAIRHRINTGNYPKVESVSEKKDIPSPDLSVEKMEGRKRLDNMFAELLMMLRETEVNSALADVESTAKALEGKTKGLELPFFRGSGKKTEDIIETSKYASKKIDEKYDIVLDETEKPPFYVIKDKMGNRVSEKEFKTKNSANDEALELLGGWDKMKAEMFSEAYHKAKADGSNPEMVRAVEEILSQKLTKFATENEPEKHGFTEGADLKAINEKLKKKYGEKEAAKLYQVALRLVNPNRNTIVEIRSSGVVINEGGKYIFLPFGNTDANSKNWILYKGMDVTDQFDKKDEKTEPAKPEPNPIMPDNQRELLQYVSSLLESGTATNIVNITSKAKQLNILDANKNPDRTKVKEITELAVCMVGRKLAHENKSLDDRYDNIVNLYNNQANLSFRTSESQMLQQYSTPVPIAFLAGVFCGFEKPGNYFEPSAGNGLLTVAGNPQDFTVNEIDWLRRRNLEYQGFRQVLDRDASKPFDDFKGTFDAAITNPPFGSIRGEKFIARGMPITKLEHMMAIHALDTLKNDGRCAIIIGGHTPYDSKGRIVQGSNRNFYVYLAHFYNLVDSINISGKMYSRQGTTFDVRLILIDGKKNKPEGFPPLADVTSASTEVWSVKPVMNYDEFFERMLNNINK